MSASEPLDLSVRVLPVQAERKNSLHVELLRFLNACNSLSLKAYALQLV